MSPNQIIVLATPVFFLLIGIEFACSRLRQRRGASSTHYRFNDTINSISLGMLSQLGNVFTSLLRVGIYTAVYASLSLVPAQAADAFWTSLPGWLAALVLYDFCYYWLHRMGHESAVLWAAHVVHHQSQHYNLSTALRQTGSGVLLGWVFYLPMALAGVPPLVFGAVALIDLLYQFWVHTELVGKLGRFDRWFCSPSNHRVHHAVNDAYVDRNYGGILMLWDHLFGSFTEERDNDPCIYGTRSPLKSLDPLWANAEVYWGLARDSWHARHWSDKLRVWTRPPGWRPADVAARFPRPPFNIRQVRPFDPPASRATQVFAGLHFVALLGGVAVFLWMADAMPTSAAMAWAGALTCGLWCVGAVLQGRVSAAAVVLLDILALVLLFVN